MEILYILFLKCVIGIYTLLNIIHFIIIFKNIRNTMNFQDCQVATNYNWKDLVSQYQRKIFCFSTDPNFVKQMPNKLEHIWNINMMLLLLLLFLFDKKELQKSFVVWFYAFLNLPMACALVIYLKWHFIYSTVVLNWITVEYKRILYTSLCSNFVITLLLQSGIFMMRSWTTLLTALSLIPRNFCLTLRSLLLKQSLIKNLVFAVCYNLSEKKSLMLLR